MVRWCFHERIIYSGISTSRGFSMFPSLNSPACYVWLPNGISPLLNSKTYPVSPHFHHTNWFVKMFLKIFIHVPSTIPFFHIFPCLMTPTGYQRVATWYCWACGLTSWPDSAAIRCTWWSAAGSNARPASALRELHLQGCLWWKVDLDLVNLVNLCVFF